MSKGFRVNIFHKRVIIWVMESKCVSVYVSHLELSKEVIVNKGLSVSYLELSKRVMVRKDVWINVLHQVLSDVITMN